MFCLNTSSASWPLPSSMNKRILRCVWCANRLQLTQSRSSKVVMFTSMSVGRTDPRYAITKSLNGLQRFVDLPIEFFSARDTTADVVEARVLRRVCSSMLRGILEGYARARFGNESGWQFLPRFPRSWSHSLPFLVGVDFEALLELVEPGEFSDGVARSVRPLVGALDELTTRLGDYVPLPVSAQLNWEARRLDTSIQPPPYAVEPQLIEIQCYLDGSFVTRAALEEQQTGT